MKERCWLLLLESKLTGASAEKKTRECGKKECEVVAIASASAALGVLRGDWRALRGFFCGNGGEGGERGGNRLVGGW